jgi:hypothetical protein
VTCVALVDAPDPVVLIKPLEFGQRLARSWNSR